MLRARGPRLRSPRRVRAAPSRGSWGLLEQCAGGAADRARASGDGFGEIEREQTMKLGDAPGLRRASSGPERLLRVEDFGNLAKARVGGQMPFQRLEKTPAGGEVFCRPSESGEVRSYIRAEKPRPDRSLVVGRVALPGTTAEVRDVLRLAGGERPEPVGRKKLLLDDAYCRTTLRGIEQREGQGEREELVGPGGRVVTARTSDHVVEAAARRIPECSRER